MNISQKRDKIGLSNLVLFSTIIKRDVVEKVQCICGVLTGHPLLNYRHLIILYF